MNEEKNESARAASEGGRKTLNEEESAVLLQQLREELAMFMAEYEDDTKQLKKAPRPEVDILFNHGTFQQQIEMQMALLTQAVARCMLHASGDFVDQETVRPSPYVRRYDAPPPASYPIDSPATRFAQLQNAARLAEASASLVHGYARFRSHVDQQFSLRHTASHNKTGKKVRISSLMHRFTAPRDEAIPDARSLGAEVAKDLQPENDA